MSVNLWRPAVLLSYLKVGLHGPPVALWRPDSYMTSLVRRCHRSALDNQTRKAQPTHEILQIIWSSLEIVLVQLICCVAALLRPSCYN